MNYGVIIMCAPQGSGLAMEAAALASAIGANASVDLEKYYAKVSSEALTNNQSIGAKATALGECVAKLRRKAAEYSKWCVAYHFKKSGLFPDQYVSGLPSSVLHSADMVMVGDGNGQAPIKWDIIKTPAAFKEAVISKPGEPLRLMGPIDFTPVGEFGAQMYDVLWSEEEWTCMPIQTCCPMYHIDTESGISITDQLSAQGIKMSFMSIVKNATPPVSPDEIFPVQLTGTKGEHPSYDTHFELPEPADIDEVWGKPED